MSFRYLRDMTSNWSAIKARFHGNRSILSNKTNTACLVNYSNRAVIDSEFKNDVYKNVSLEASFKVNGNIKSIKL